MFYTVLVFDTFHKFVEVLWRLQGIYLLVHG
jgi:hypothetical protein